ncbi:MAG: isocitrate lyase/phosphoenolpyruvate mutase family protein [Gemmatimonadota bacterium]
MQTQRERAAHFRGLHSRPPLVLPNAWDAASARVIERAGATAIATTSAGVAWTYGRRDGEQLTRDDMLEVVARITRTVNVPVTADVEGGYGTGSIRDVDQTVRRVVEVGAVGINLEDSPGKDGAGLLAADAHAERIRAAREGARAAGGDIVINARTDVYLYEIGAPETRFDETVARARHYLAAGADCLFVPGVRDAATISALVRAIAAPINILAGPGAPTIAELRELGVARVSLGPRLVEAALAATQVAAREVLQSGTYASLAGNLSFSEIQGLFPG